VALKTITSKELWFRALSSRYGIIPSDVAGGYLFQITGTFGSLSVFVFLKRSRLMLQGSSRAIRNWIFQEENHLLDTMQGEMDYSGDSLNR
jgi:hypothetical protein